MICQKPDCLFIHIPKTAGQSVEQAFLDLNGLSWAEEERGQLLLRPNADPAKGPPRLAHLTASEYLQYGYLSQQQFDAKYKFAFVRNPWDRLVSEYLYSHMGLYDFRTFILQQFPVPESDDYQRAADVYRHVLPQANFLYDDSGNCLVDYVGRFEKLQADFKRVCQALDIPAIELKKQNTFTELLTNRAIQEGQIQPGQKLKIEKPHYSEFYDADTRAFVDNYYARDIELFGYNFETA